MVKDTLFGGYREHHRGVAWRVHQQWEIRMSGYVGWRVEAEVQPARMNELTALMNEMVHSTQEESGTLIYEWSFNSDSNVCHLTERYQDSDAALIHLGTFGQRFASRFFDLLNVKRIVIYGSPNDAVKAALADAKPEVMTQKAGFSRI